MNDGGGAFLGILSRPPSTIHKATKAAMTAQLHSPPVPTEPSWSDLLRTVTARSSGGRTTGGDGSQYHEQHRRHHHEIETHPTTDDDSQSTRRLPAPSSTENDDDGEDFSDEARDVQWLRALERQLERHSRLLRSGSSTLCGDGQQQVDENDEGHDSKDDREYRRRRERSATIRDTRLALRFGAAWVASCNNGHADENHEEDGSDNNNPRRRRERLQRSILDATEAHLYRILHCGGPRRSSSSADGQPQDDNNDDVKCRLYAARLLCNLVTDNADTAQRLVNGGGLLRLDPGRDELLNRQRRAILERHDEVGDEFVAAESGSDAAPPNWFDVINNNANDRDVLAAIVATLHNAVTAVENAATVAAASSSDATKNRHGDFGGAARRVAGHGLIVNALLRHVVSSPSIVAPHRAHLGPPTSDDVNQMSTPLDDASDWIMVYFRGLVRRGHLRTLYSAVSNCDPNGSSKTIENANRGYGALPEHVVLLFCLRQQLESEGHSNTSCWLAKLCDSEADAVGTVIFLADLYTDLSLSAPAIAPESKLDQFPSSPRSESAWTMERGAVHLRVLDLLGDLLQDDSNSEALALQARSAVGQHSNFFQRLSGDLTALVDKYSYAQELQAANADSNADVSQASIASRNGRRVNIPPQDQERLTSSVRLLGNLCYRCRPNQDLLRSIVAPSSSSSPSSTRSEGRNVLHILLTSTSLAPYCFTLREWAVVAIRNALEDNSENQSVLAELQAQQPVTSAALTDMGVRIDMDATTGKINVVPLDE